MDHLPLPKDPIFNHPEVPLLCSLDFEYPYKRVSFSDYPELCGYKKDELLEYGIQDDSAEAIQKHARFFQGWLYFGLLCEFSRRIIQTSEFVHTNEEGLYCISTASLGEIVRQYEAHKKTEEASVSEAHTVALQVVFSQCNEYSEALDQWHRDHKHVMPVLGLISFSIISLAATLELAVMSDPHREGQMTWMPWYHGEYVKSALRSNGTCPQLMRMLEKELDPPEAYYVSMLPGTRASHSRCEDTQCLEYVMHEEAYVTSHLRESCGCDEVHVDEAAVCTILQAGGIPILETRMNTDGAVTVEPVDSKKRRVYVAISHVWSDGLGNPHGNSLPKCQLVKLQSISTSICEDLNGNIAFWMDTLAVPHTKKERKMAITRMRKTYEEAHRVLVIVRDFQDIDKDITYLEFFFRMLCCTWMRRLWTLQEGVMARKLYFWLKGGPVSFDAMTEAWRQNYTSFPRFGNKLGEVLNNWRGLGRPWGLDSKFQWVHKAVQFRTTSKQQDEAICLATIFDFDLEPILQLDTAEGRMKRFWLSMNEIPAGILWMQVPRLLEDGLRWVPSTLLNTGLRAHFYGGKPLKLGHVEPGGLRLTSPGFLLAPTSIPLQDDFYFRSKSTGAYYAVFSTEPPVAAVGAPTSRSAIMLQLPLEEMEEKLMRTYRAVKVSVQSTEAGEIYGRFERNVNLWIVWEHKYAERDQQRLSEKEKAREEKRGAIRYIIGEELGPEQSWVIG